MASLPSQEVMPDVNNRRGRTVRARSKAGRRATLFAASALLAPAALGSWFAAAIKAINPDGVDVTHELAYLRPILVGGFVLAGLFVVASALVNLRTQSVHGAAARTAWLVLGVQLLLAVLLVAGRAIEASVTGG